MAKASDGYADKFIGFVDILGFSSLTKKSSAGEIAAILACLGIEQDREDIASRRICPEAPFIKPNLDFALTQQFDTVVVTTEVSPAGIINLLGHCWIASLKLLGKGLMCRGYIKRGKVFHEDRVYGPGHSDAAEMEKKVSFYKRDANDLGTPFIEVDKEVVQYVHNQKDECVKKRFKRFVETDGTVSAVFPFNAINMQGNVIDATPDSIERAKTNNKRIMENLANLKERVWSYVDQSNPSAVRKGEHYLRILDKQQKNFGLGNVFLERLSEPYGITATKDRLPGLFRGED
jgi:hypothetical protein